MTFDVGKETKSTHLKREDSNDYSELGSEAFHDSTKAEPVKSFNFLLEKINSIQDIMLKSGLPFHELNLPQICVVGSQSVGKSSVLESFVGREFLPRGKGIVTRRPLLLQLRNIKQDEEFGEFEHISGKRFYDFNTIRDEIVRETNDSLGENTKCISKDPIGLKISSPYVVDLTVIDLPGVTKVPIGNQPVDIEQITKDLVITFIEKKSCIILAVSSATEDLANSVALALAREVDPEHQRTIGVITKIDCLGGGHDVVDSLMNRTYRLSLGYIGVVFRDAAAECQSTIREARKDEMEFFESRREYRNFRDRIGSEHLSKVLNKRLLLHIKESLPGTLLSINKLIDEKFEEIKQLGLNPDESEEISPKVVIRNAIRKFKNRYKNLLEGRIITTNSTTNEVYVGGAKISNRLHTELPKTLEDIDEATQMSDNEIRNYIKNASGTECYIFIPEQAFKTLVKKRVREFEQPALEMVKKISEDMIEILEKSRTVDTIRYENLQRNILEAAKTVVQTCLKPTREMIKNLFKIETNCVNTNHPDFIINQLEFTGIKDIQSLTRITENERMENARIEFERRFAAASKSKHKKDCVKSDYSHTNKNIGLDNFPKVLTSDDFGGDTHVAMIKRIVDSYVKIVIKNITDAVHKTIMTLLVKESRSSLHHELIDKLCKPEKFDTLLEQSEECVLREQNCRDNYNALIKSREKLRELQNSDC